MASPWTQGDTSSSSYICVGLLASMQSQCMYVCTFESTVLLLVPQMPQSPLNQLGSVYSSCHASWVHWARWLHQGSRGTQVPGANIHWIVSVHAEPMYVYMYVCLNIQYCCLCHKCHKALGTSCTVSTGPAMPPGCAGLDGFTREAGRHKLQKLYMHWIVSVHAEPIYVCMYV